MLQFAVHARRALVGTIISAVVAAIPALHAQSVITVRAGSGGPISYSAATAVGVPIVVDMSAAGGTTLGSLTTLVQWGPARLTFDSVKVGAFGTVTVKPRTWHPASCRFPYSTAQAPRAR